MKVELIKDVDRLGKKGDVVGVFPRVADELIKAKKAKDPNAPVKPKKEEPKE